MNTVTQSAITEEVEGLERAIIPLCGKESVLLHIDVIRDKLGIIDLAKTKASLQIKKEETVSFYCCFDWCCPINLSLNKEGYVCNRKDNGASRGAYDEWYCAGNSTETNKTPTTAILTSLIEPLEFLDNIAFEYRFRDLQETLSWKFKELKEKEKIALFDELFPGLKYKTKKSYRSSPHEAKAINTKSQVKSQSVLGGKNVEGTIYLIGNRENNTLKIGFSENSVQARLAAFQVSCAHRLEIIKTKKGDLQDERELLEKFKEFNIRREWFRWDNSIIDGFDENNK